MCDPFFQDKFKLPYSVTHNLNLAFSLAPELMFSHLQVLRVQSKAGRFLLHSLNLDSTLDNLQTILQEKTNMHPDSQKSEQHTPNPTGWAVSHFGLEEELELEVGLNFQ